MKKELNAGKAGLVLEKLIADTESNAIRWHKLPIDKVLIEKNLGEADALEQHGSYHFQSEIPGDVKCNIQVYENVYYVWLEREGEIAHIIECEPGIKDLITRLDRLVKFYSDIQLYSAIDEYIGIPVEDKASLIQD